MAQTKRKRRTKHRGNAAGVVESRGRTGRAPTAQERNRNAPKGPMRNGREMKEPTWQGAFTKAGLMSVLLFVITRLNFLGGDIAVSQSIIVALLALALYTPLSYFTDRWVYNRQLRKQQQQARS